ncbi:MAG: hypothetical protein ABEJ93_03895, partial [Candidatus Nanohalobium sp.]
NIAGKETSYSVDVISKKLLEEADHVIDKGALEERPTSTIAEVNNGEVVVHRRGPVRKRELEEALN